MSARDLLNAFAGKLKTELQATLEKKVSSIAGHAPAAHPPGAKHVAGTKKPKKPRKKRVYSLKQRGTWRANERAGKYNF